MVSGKSHLQQVKEELSHELIEKRLKIQLQEISNLQSFSNNSAQELYGEHAKSLAEQSQPPDVGEMAAPVEAWCL